jgi:hypothetical protein
VTKHNSSGMHLCAAGLSNTAIQPTNLHRHPYRQQHRDTVQKCASSSIQTATQRYSPQICIVIHTDSETTIQPTNLHHYPYRQRNSDTAHKFPPPSRQTSHIQVPQC